MSGVIFRLSYAKHIQHLDDIDEIFTIYIGTLNPSGHGLEMSGNHVMVAKQLTTTLTFSTPSVTALSNSRQRRVSKRVFV